MHPDDERLYLLLDRYLAGEASAAEAQIVREHPELLADLQLIKRIISERIPDSDVDAAWAKAAPALTGKPRRSRRIRLVALAAAAVVVTLIGGWAMLWRTPAWREVSTAVAHRAVVRLRDGTQVTLAPTSHLRYAGDYGKSQRDVYLDGEAYFQVTPDTRRPFRVHTARSVTEDLGTAFVVRAYADQSATEVVVAEGRVALWRADTALTSATRRARPDARPGLVLEARDLGRLDANGGATFRRGIDVARQLAWTRGILAFDGTPLRDVVHTLGRWYDVEVRVGDADTTFAARRLTATFTNEPINLVLQRIALTLGLRVDHTAGSVFVLRNAR